MLIHLHQIDGRAFVTIDPEGEPLPSIETLSGPVASFRLSWSSERSRTEREEGACRPSPPPAARLSATSGTAAQEDPAGHRIGRYAAMIGAFAVMLVVGMVIGTLRGTTPHGGAIPASDRYHVAGDHAVARRSPPYETSDPWSHEGAGDAGGPSFGAAPVVGSASPGGVAPVQEPSAGVAPASRPVVPPGDPARLFGLHS
ncbi:MAG: hypothetical protein PHT60_15045 [Acidiphilium sp.]|nr:hypothetical protein [Acidiphilium sp.]MDD4937079.1 hypothetical protein [Acidiphilium sp.]